MYRKLLPFLTAFLVLILAASCRNTGTGSAGNGLPMKYSEFLNIRTAEGYTTVEIRNPWDTARILHRYQLVPKGTELPAGLPEGTVIRTPADRIIIYSSVHAMILKELGETDRIAGLCDIGYLTDPELKRKVTEGTIADCGNSMSPNIEVIASAGGELIIASPFENSTYGAVEKLRIPILEAADYTETSPLGRCEWIRLYGHLLGCPEKADSLFQATEERYLTLKNTISENLKESRRPQLITERKYGNVWGTPGGRSYAAVLYGDAGADYIFKDDPSTGTIQKSFETVLEKGVHADLWILKYTSSSPMSYQDLKNEYELYSHFDAFRKEKIYACNTLTTDYYDIITLHPDRILSDLASIFHPGLFPEHELRYFQPLLQSPQR